MNEPDVKRVYFKVPFAEKDLAKKNGAKWDGKRRKWWFPEDKVTDFITKTWKVIIIPVKPENVRVNSVAAPDGARIIRGWFDGGSRGNPGNWGYGSVLRHGNGRMIGVRMGAGKNGTNNEAEYRGALSLLQMIREECEKSVPDPRAHVIVLGDSNLVIKALNREWKCKSESLQPIFNEAIKIIDDLQENRDKYGIESITFEHVYRDKNAEADNLANIAMDRL
jgi:ribonuclease HI